MAAASNGAAGKGADWATLVFRLRRLPPAVQDDNDVAELLGRTLPDISPADISVLSLARTLDDRRGTKVATLKFLRAPSLLDAVPTREGWIVPLPSPEDALILDHHFRGLTPLVEAAEGHDMDCVAITGLGGHVLGSWQEKGNKEFLWIRDYLPKELPTMRMILFGYDTTLKGTHSFKTTYEIANDLISHLTMSGWGEPSAKPIVFLAHSLGGVIFKQAVVAIANSPAASTMLRLLKGAVFFGVPNFGMDQAHLETAVCGQPSERLVKYLRSGNETLLRMDEAFANLAASRSMEFLWGYETLESPIALTASGKFDPDGPRKQLVSPHSATRGLCHDPKASGSVFAIDETHSDMAKFGDGSLYSKRVADFLSKLSLSKTSPQTSPSPSMPMLGKWGIYAALDHSTERTERQLSAQDIARSLDAPDLSYRESRISAQHQYTYGWVFEKDAFNEWLDAESGLFWFKGKPGSGKSVMMRFILRQPRTQERLHSLLSGPAVCLGFFFWYGGSLLQRSRQGLLRSILSGLLRQRPEVAEILRPIIGNATLSRLESDFWDETRLTACFRLVLEQKSHPLRLCLFIDALDEYGGAPEGIVHFLEEICGHPYSSLTKIKICFSSWPWEAIEKSFALCPTITIHEETREDIRQYCLGQMGLHIQKVGALRDLVDDIVRLSQGVFLWVRLVVEDLDAFLRSATDHGTVLRDKARRRLDSFPRQLDLYYQQRILQRVSHHNRFKSYAILEILSRPMRSLRLNWVWDLYTLVAATEFAPCSTFQEAEQVLVSWFDASNKPRSRENMQRLLNRYSGGLIEIDGPYSNLSAHFMHKTVIDLISSPDFKTAILGDLAPGVFENGFSFQFKFFSLLCMDPRVRSLMRGKRVIAGTVDMLRFTAAAAENTTGQVARYLGSIPEGLILKTEEMQWTKITSVVGFAVYCGVLSYLQEYLRRRPAGFESTSQPLLTVALLGVPGQPDSSDVDSVISTIRFLFENGYSLEQDPRAWGLLFQLLATIWQGSLQQGNRAERIVALFLDNGQDPSVFLRLPSGDSRYSPLRGATALHAAILDSGQPTSTLVEMLLKHGVDPNVRDFIGRTPLDLFLLQSPYTFSRSVRVLVENGGLTTSKREWDRLWVRLHGQVGEEPSSVFKAAWSKPSGGTLPQFFGRVLDRLSRRTGNR